MNLKPIFLNFKNMKKKIIILLTSLIVLFVAVVGTAFIIITPGKDKILDFIKENPDRSAISLSYNKGEIVEHNADRKLPLASTLKIMIAIEYAYQSARGKISPSTKVPMAEIEKYHYPKTDGGAHNRWKNSFGIVDNDSCTLKELAQGMLKFSSNANTEYLMDVLGPQNINNRIENLGITKHDSIYYLVSSLFIKDYLFSKKEDAEAVNALRKLPMEDYIDTCKDIHNKLKTNTFKQDSLNNFGLEAQKIWSDKLPGSTANAYRKLMEKLNAKELPESVHQQLDPVLEFIMENPQNQSWLEHSGMKGGSTASLLTKALYAKRTNGNKIALSYFLTDLSYFEQIQLSKSMNAFEIAILQDESFRESLNKICKDLEGK
jgi:D-alanyl-D-alanine carboxypeptidase